MDLGRFQPGQDVRIGVATVDVDGNPAWPVLAPVSTVKDADNNTIFSGKIPMSGLAYIFSRQLFLGLLYPVGIYQVNYAWTVGSFNGTASDTFEVISGGDVGGGIIAMYAYVRPEATYVVAQLSSGNIVQGRNPRLEV